MFHPQRHAKFLAQIYSETLQLSDVKRMQIVCESLLVNVYLSCNVKTGVFYEKGNVALVKQCIFGII